MGAFTYVGERMGNYRIDPKKQFSKRLARWTAVFWFLYLTWISILMMLQPSVAQYAFYMGIVSTVVMIVNQVSYTHNSVMEKLCYMALDKVRIEMSATNTNKTDSTETESDADEGEVSNG